METRFIILISIVLIVFIINRLYVRADEKRKIALKDKKTLSDKEIISMFEDPLTGEKAKVSETQTNYEYSDEISDEVVFYNEQRKTSEEVIDKYYTEGELEREFILIKNFLLDNRYKFKFFSDSEFNFLEKTKTFSSFEDWNSTDSYHKNQLSIFIANTTAKVYNSKYSSRTENYSIVFWIKDFIFFGHYCFFKKPIVQNIIDVFIDEEKEIIKGYQTEIIKKSHQENAIKDYFKTINFENDLEIEIIDSNIIIRITNFASRENLIKLFDSIKNSEGK
ncbi:hypothetical protein GCM10022389_14810 [Flavobacterium cheonanense]|uniref:Uncharacterized protein n=1 Tax=Flavobacterium cheonanense TaxID=706183 RepID=A0ABP7VN14_9FLAO